MSRASKPASRPRAPTRGSALRASGITKLVRTSLDLEPGWIYFLDGQGDVARLTFRGARATRPQKILRTAVSREPGFLYFVDREGDVVRVPLAQ